MLETSCEVTWGMVWCGQIGGIGGQIGGIGGQIGGMGSQIGGMGSQIGGMGSQIGGMGSQIVWMLFSLPEANDEFLLLVNDHIVV